MNGVSENRQASLEAFTTWQERSIIMRDFKNELLRHTNLSVGFSLFWVWIFLVFQTNLFSPSLFSVHAITLPPWIIPLSSYALVFAVLGLLFKRKGIVPCNRWYHRAIPLSMSLGIGICGLLTVFSLDFATLNVALVIGGGLILGAGTACLHTEWGRMMGKLGSRKTIIHGIVATIFAAVLLLVLTVLPTPLLLLCTIAIPPASMLLLQSEAKRYSRTFYQHGMDSKSKIPWKWLLTSFLQGFSFGIAQAVLLLGNYGETAMILTAGSFALSTLILVVCALFFKMDFNQLIYQVGFLIIAAGFLLAALLGIDSPSSLFVHSTGYRFVDIMMWALCVYMVKQHNLSANWVFACTTCALLVGRVIGALTGSILSVLDEGASVSLDGQALVITMVFVLLASALLLSSKKNLTTGWGMIRPGDNEDYLSNFDMGCKLVCREYSLTAREEEVFVLLARGHNRTRMCETLTLSKETVKTHIRNIYRKMDIHSQQDAFFLVENAQKDFGYNEEASHEMRA